MSRHVVVIGAGIVGACTAVELLRGGCRVAILEAGEAGGRQAASFGNGAWISPASIVPMSMPGLWRKVPGFLLDPLGPLTIRWTALPGLASWLMRFLKAGSSVARVERTARLLSALLADAPARHKDLAGEAGAGHLIRQSGLLYAYPDRAAFEAESLAWRLRRDNGVAWSELEETELRAFEPSLGPQYRLGILVGEGAHCLDPGAYVAALVAHAVSRGARLVKAQATGFVFHAGRLSGVNVGGRETIACDTVVLAAGIGSRSLARQAGDSVPLVSERGYHVEIRDPALTLAVPVMPSDGKMGITMTEGGLRAAGQVELAAVEAAPDWRRADVLLDHLKRAFPPLAGTVRPDSVARWMGHRPSTPDGLPVIGRSTASADIFHAFGHGHVGLAAGPATGRIVADIVCGRVPAVPVEPYRAARFR